MDELPETPVTLGKAQRLRRYLIAGLLVWLPILVTLFVLRFLVGLMDQTLLLLPENARPEALLGFRIPGLGLVLAIVLLLATGLAATNLVGRKLIRWWEGLMTRIPFVRSLYSGTKTFTETVFSGKGQAFQKVLLVQYPRQGIWTLAFLTSQEFQEPGHRTGRDLLGVFVPTTPNPTSGFIIMMPREDVIVLDMSVEDAMRVILTLGVVTPAWRADLPAAGPRT
jgi:uncharacterized membrane protein